MNKNDYTTQKTLFLYFLGLYFVVGMSNEYISERLFNSGVEWYPVFAWDLFSSIPNEQDNFLMSINNIGDEIYIPPLEFRQTEDLFVSQGISPTEYTPIIQKLGWSAVKNDEAQIIEHTNRIEAIFSGQPYSYDIYEVVYDPVDFWRDGTYKSKELVLSVDRNNHAK